MLRVLLLARNDGDWWTQLTQDRDLGPWLTARSPLPLAAVATEALAREEVFREAVTAYAVARGKAVVAPAGLRFDDARFERVLYLHMAALAVVEGLPVDAGALMDAMLDHEERFWERRGRESGDALDVAMHLTDAQQLVAAGTLRGGFASQDEARAVFKRMIDRSLDRDDARLLALLHRVYARRGETVWQPPLEPDLLGEAMVVRVARPRRAEEAPPADWIERVFPVEDAGPAVRVGFTVLGRASAWAPAETRPWIEGMLRGPLDVRAVLAFEAARLVGRRTAFSTLGEALSVALEARGNAAVAERLRVAGLPHPTVALAHVVEWVCRTLLDAPLAKNFVTKLILLHNHAMCLEAVGRYEDSLRVASTAVSLCEKTRHAGVERRSMLAASLRIRATAFRELKRFEEALRDLERAEQLAAGADEDACELMLIREAKSSVLQELGHLRESLDVIEAGLEPVNQIFGNSEIAGPLRNLMDLFARKDTAERSALLPEALQVFVEMVGTTRRLVEADADLHTLTHYEALRALSRALVQGEQFDRAILTLGELLLIGRKLHETNPQVYTPKLAEDLMLRGTLRYRAAALRDALKDIEESVQLQRGLTAQSPDEFLPDLATSLANLGGMLSNLGRWEEALTATQEAVQIRRQLAARNPDAFLPDLANSHGALGQVLRAHEQPHAAADAFLSGAELLESLRQRLPEAFNPLAQALRSRAAETLDALGPDAPPELRQRLAALPPLD